MPTDKKESNNCLRLAREYLWEARKHLAEDDPLFVATGDAYDKVAALVTEEEE